MGILAGYSAIFSWPGMSFTLSRKILEVVEGKLRPENLKPWIYFRFSEVIHCFFKGEWDRIPPCDEILVERSLNIGEFFYTTTYLDILCHFHIERGLFDLAARYLQKIQNISTTYDYDYATDEYHFLKTLMLLKLRRISEARARPTPVCLRQTARLHGRDRPSSPSRPKPRSCSTIWPELKYPRRAGQRPHQGERRSPLSQLVSDEPFSPDLAPAGPAAGPGVRESPGGRKQRGERAETAPQLAKDRL